jgi:hypothetical protein
MTVIDRCAAWRSKAIRAQRVGDHFSLNLRRGRYPSLRTHS